MLFLPRPLRALTLWTCLFFLPFGLSALTAPALPGTWTDAFSLARLPDGSLLVAQRSGLVDKLSYDGVGFREPIVWADLGDNGQAQLLGFTVDPDYLSNGYLYAALQVTKDGVPVVQLTRWRESGGLVVLNRVLVDNLPSGTERTGGVLKVGPDGKLWLGLGDGGAPASSITAGDLRTGLLRFEADGSIPADNPTPGSPVWAHGYRDPGALAWQPGTNKLFSLDRGPAVARGTNDRLDVVEKGLNFGWPRYTARDWAKGVTRALTYCSSGHSWVPNGAVFATNGEWKGSLLYAGSGQGYLYRMTLDTSKSPAKITFYEELIGGDLGPLMDVGLGLDGTPYLLSRTHLYLLKP